MVPNYRSLVGGFFWDGTKIDADGKKVPVSVRANNPGAVNGAKWERELPGYVAEIKYDGINPTTIFETPEHGVAVYWELLRLYRDKYKLKTVWGILGRYIGAAGQLDYFRSVNQMTGYGRDTVIDLDDDAVLMPFAKAQFRHEAGVKIPWSDAQIKYGFEMARARAKGAPEPKPEPEPVPYPQRPQTPDVPEAPKPWWQSILEWFSGNRPAPGPTPKPTPSQPILKLGDVNNQVRWAQEALLRAGYLDDEEDVDGEFGAVTDNAVRQFQLAHNLDPDGEVGVMTAKELAKVIGPMPEDEPQPDPRPDPVSSEPTWYSQAKKDIGFRETGTNRGIEHFIRDAKAGSLGDPWCAICVNAWLERGGVRGTRSAMARSFERDPNFIKLSGPALGAVVTMWRNSPGSGLGHVFLYDGESSKGVRGIGGNESDMVKRSFHDRGRVVGYYWPKAVVPLPKVGKIMVADDGSVINTKET